MVSAGRVAYGTNTSERHLRRGCWGIVLRCATNASECEVNISVRSFVQGTLFKLVVYWKNILLMNTISRKGTTVGNVQWCMTHACIAARSSTVGVICAVFGWPIVAALSALLAASVFEGTSSCGGTITASITPVAASLRRCRPCIDSF